MNALTSEDRKLINTLITERNLKQGSHRRFISPLRKYLEYHKNKYTMTELLREALEEQDTTPNPQKTRLYTYLTEFRMYLNERISPRTLQNYMIQIREIYRHYGVILPELKPFKLREQPQVTYEDIPSREDIRHALEIVPLDMRALILFQSSSGTSLHESCTITIRMFLDACKDYLEDETSTSIPYLLNKLKTVKDIIPIFYLERVKTNKYYYTCCSSEATYEIINYLLLRLDQDETLTPDSHVFPLYKNVYTKRYWSINKKLGLGFVGKYSKFRSHALRKFHASNIGCSVELIDELQGRGKSVIHEAYIKDRPSKIREEYKKYVNNVMINMVCDEPPLIDEEEHINITVDTEKQTVKDNPVIDTQVYVLIGKLEQRVEQLEHEIKEIRKGGVKG